MSMRPVEATAQRVAALEAFAASAEHLIGKTCYEHDDNPSAWDASAEAWEALQRTALSSPKEPSPCIGMWHVPVITCTQCGTTLKQCSECRVISGHTYDCSTVEPKLERLYNLGKLIVDTARGAPPEKATERDPCPDLCEHDDSSHCTEECFEKARQVWAWRKRQVDRGGV